MNKINQKVNHGFVKPQIDDTHYKFGLGQVSLAQPIQLNSDWTESLPIEEDQNLRGIETSNCTGFAATNQVESYMKKKFGINVNYSDRFLGIMAGTDPKIGGNDPQKVYEAIRKYGLIPEEMLPFSDDIQSAEEYFSWKGGNKDKCITEGKQWLSKYYFYHDWVADGKETTIDILRTALQYSIVCGSVYAWANDENGIYIRLGSDTHWTSFYKIDNYLEVFDSYDPNKKQLNLKFGIKYAKRIHIELNDDVKISIYSQILTLISKIISFDWILVNKIKNEQSDVKIEPVIETPKSIEPIPIESKYLWSTVEECHHSVRVLCDEEGLSYADKNLIAAVIKVESDFNPLAEHKNVNGSTDWGICQYNDNPFYGWIGENGIFKNHDEVLQNPEKCVRIMIGEFKKGNIKYWSAYLNLSYMKWLGKV